MRGDAIDFTLMRTFVAVAARGSFTAAAAALGLTQQAVSAQMARLEAILGQALFVRGEGRVRPSPDGETFHLYALRALALEQEIRSHFAQTDPTAPVRFGMVETFVDTGLSALMAAIAAQQPRIAIEVRIDTAPNMLPLLEAGHLDVVLGGERTTESNGKPLWVETQHWVGDPALLPRDGGPVPLVLRTAPSLTRSIATEALVAAGIPFRILLECDRMDVLRIAIANGVGIGIMTESDVRDEPVIRDDLPALPPIRAFLRVRRSDDQPSRRLGDLITAATGADPA